MTDLPKDTRKILAGVSQRERLRRGKAGKYPFSRVSVILGPSRYEYIEERSYGNVFDQVEYQKESKLTFRIYYETIGRLASQFKIQRWYVEEILRTCFSSCKVYKDPSITGYTVFSADTLLRLSYSDMERAVGRWARRKDDFCYLAQELPGFVDAGHY